jgi:predicted MFS family arabinose efflux permease
MQVGNFVGPLVCGYLAELAGAYRVFHLVAICTLVPASLAWRVARLEATPPQRRSVNPASTLLLFAGTAAVVLGLDALGEAPWSWRTASLFAGAAAALVALGLRERTAPARLFEPDLFGDRAVQLNLLGSVAQNTALAAALVLLPFHLQRFLGSSLGEVGQVFAVQYVIGMATGPVAGRLSDRYGARFTGMIGALLSLGASVGLASMGGDAGKPTVMMWSGLLGLATGFFRPANQVAILRNVKVSGLGAASGAISMSINLGNALGAALVGALLQRRLDVHGEQSPETFALAWRALVIVSLIPLYSAWTAASTRRTVAAAASQ